MADQDPSQPPPPYPGDASKAYPPAGAPYPPQQAPYPQPAGYPPQGQPGYPPQPAAGGFNQPQPASYQQPAATEVVVTGPTVTTVMVNQQYLFRDLPVRCQCKNCGNEVTTQVTHEPGLLAWLICGGFCLIGFWLCCCIPFCVDGMQNAIHHCPVCKYRIATYNR